MFFRRHNLVRAADQETVTVAAQLKEGLQALRDGNFAEATLQLGADNCLADLAGEMNECVAVLKDFTRQTILQAAEGAVC
ncbi:MAG: hypothetical protein D9V47_03400 [Clostridia bacterium]|nr:MAG: hypothetical protein D9V47_03400 [Clostridia bacterium]